MQLVNGLHFDNIRGDIYGGLTAAVVALPLAMAMGVASGVGPIAGMYGAIFVGFFAALLGGTPAQVSGPTGPMTVVMAAIFVQYTSMFPDDPMQGAALAFTVVVLGGLFQIAMGLLKIGKFIELVPHPVVSGFMSGIGVIIILLQLGPLLGQAAVSKPLAAAQAVPEFFHNLDQTSLLLGLVALVIVYGIPKFLPVINRMVPSPLIALVAGTAAYVFFVTPGTTPIIGDIPTGFPEFHFPAVDPTLILEMIASGLTLAGLGAIDSLLTSLVADNVTHTQHKSDRELIGQGIGNTIAGLFGGLPGAGATMRTVVNVNAGGRTPISGALHAVILLAIVLGAGSLASDIPKAVLAGILIKVGTDIIDWDYLRRIKAAPPAGIIIMATVLVVTVVVDLLLAVGIGMVMASFLFMHRMTQLQLAGIRTHTNADDANHLSVQEADILDASEGRIMMFHLSGPMSFSSAKAMVRRHASTAGYEIMILDMTEVPMIDFSATRALEDIVVDTIRSGRRLFLVGARKEVCDILMKQGITSHFKPGKMYKRRMDALLHAQTILAEER
ncbi:MAG TPA: SulP family inorganic anion transporter [Chromatiaceae bacterium]|jgi:SulP family sulfate permease|nr:SulP family inorganic anion transporter [Chromatiaceae bacterium]HIN81947.1 SulP family inorganic anion transporter [Chromatiales bacterium]HIA08397.1 SulP family inorganic anion transporter [Chromatiaceae bacterium]HIB83420.1 SulP family inorganic anion transporter [Chromatiaceae bacterium]HIO14577.1 SulP family inorganic anion transporter [Chromatiales bacterium]